MQTGLALILVILSILGMADSGYITWEKYHGVIPKCGDGFDCGAVLNSEWATVGPVPLSAIGFLYYLTFFVLATMLVIEFDFTRTGKRIANKLQLSSWHPIHMLTVHDLIVPLSTLGFLFSLFLVSLMAFIIEAWCQFCLYSAITSTLIFLVVVYLETRHVAPTPNLLKYVTFNAVGLLYRNIVKNIAFLFDAEAVHNFFLSTGQMLGLFRVTKWKTALMFSFQHSKLHQEQAGIMFPNGVGLAAGFDYNGMLTQISPSIGFGFHTIGTVTYQSYAGNTKPRLGRFPQSKALLVNKGLKNLGAHTIITQLKKITFHIPTGISIASTNTYFKSHKEQLMDILCCFLLFEKSGLDHSYYEMNISCPNTFGGEPFTEPNRLEQLLTCLDSLKISKPLFLKMPIDQSEKKSLALLKVANMHKVDGLVIGNLTKDKNNPAVAAQDREEWKKKAGNLSGRPTFERSNSLIRLARSHYKKRFVIIGTGGVLTPDNALEKLAAGADIIQLITGMIYTGPQVVGEINQRIFLSEKT